MFYSLHGILRLARPGVAVVDCGGVGYLCAVSDTTLRALPAPGNEVLLYTHLAVREDAMDLYGFAQQEELDLFRLLIGISGVGPKAAMAILGELPPERLAVCIAAGDAKTITRAPGVGAKIAQRVVLELKDKVGGFAAGGVLEEVEAAGAANASGNAADAVEALVSFGYSRSEASLAVGRLDSALPADQLIKQALKTLGKF